MNILSVGHFDAAGVNTRFAKRWNKNKYGSWRTYFMRNDMNLEIDIKPTIQWIDLKKIIDESDVLIVNPLLCDGANTQNLMNDWDTLYCMNEDKVQYIFQYMLNTKKPIIFYLNGSNNTRRWAMHYNMIFKQLGVHLACSTPDLVDFFPTAKYTPSFIDYTDAFWNIERSKRGLYTIGHFPTNPKIKNTEEYVSLAKAFQTYPIKFDLTLGVPYIQSINLKRDLDFSFDHLQGYYGINSLESAVLGVINFVKLEGNNLKRFLEFAEAKNTPWQLVNTIDDVYHRIIWYLEDDDRIIFERERIQEWMKKHWSPEKHLNELNKFFSSLISNNEGYINKKE